MPEREAAVLEMVSESRWHYQWPLGVGRNGIQGMRRYGWFFWRRPPERKQEAQWVALTRIGLGIGGGRYDGGVSFGMNRQSWVYVPKEKEGWWVLDTTRRGEKQGVFIQKNEECLKSLER